ncbi:enterocin L50 family leaderless bacteriocin [Weissella viridescens]|uniref:Enterocin L50 family leaderless bacteriocin n=1 Tax=Weissella viridescens TaxID=1629 RepID=A0A3P2RAJ1_WEIVI|nr:enterocin L50 family leaderless bacteriocin [Weissella viridescens]RRG17473.1 enterocin L50 family leaderless bacteriocin [Weissella viridescens]
MGIALRLARKYGWKFYRTIMRWIGEGYRIAWMEKQLKKRTRKLRH